jgi:hypothetical protein
VNLADSLLLCVTPEQLLQVLLSAGFQFHSWHGCHRAMLLIQVTTQALFGIGVVSSLAFRDQLTNEHDPTTTIRIRPARSQLKRPNYVRLYG